MVTWDLFQELDRMRRDLDRLFDDSGARHWAFPFSRFSFLPGRASRAYPLFNLSEDRDNYHVEALAPGIEPESLQVSVVRNQLTVSGEKNHGLEKVETENVHRNERAGGKFVRVVELPAAVEESKVKAQYRDGILTITLPKVEAAKPKQIEVKVA
jgi:HSP20 family protein